MKQNRRMQIFFNLLIGSILFLCTNICDAADALPTTNTNATTDATSSQNQQMIQQIQQLQAKQQQQLAEQQALTQQPGQTNSNNVQYNQPLQPTYQSDFEYPFQNAQIQSNSSISQSAFSNAVQQALPMNPQQIHQLKQIYDASQYAAAAPAGTPPEPTATSIYVNLSPGASPPAIRLSQGFVTSLVFLDSTGAPWPVDAYDLGNPDAFDIAWDKTDNVLMIQAKTLYTYGNLAIRLRGLNTPIMLTLIPGQQVIDYRVDVTVPGFGPDAKALPINTGLPPQAAPILLDVLDGIPPQGSKQLQISEALGQAWLLNGNMYLRTQYTLLSPGWVATMSSADGTNAYQLQQTPMLLMSKNGKIINVKIGGL